MTEIIQVVTMLPKRDDAQRIASALVERKLAACAQVAGPVSSTYRWKGKVESAEEWLCVVKTRRGLFAAVEGAIREMHPYELPEILALSVADGSADYLAWVKDETEGRAR